MKSENQVYDNVIMNNMMLPRQLVLPKTWLPRCFYIVGQSLPNGYALHSSILKDVWLDLNEGREDEKRVELLITNVKDK